MKDSYGTYDGRKEEPPYEFAAETNLSQGEYDVLVRDAMLYRTSGLEYDKRLCFALGMKSIDPEEALNVIDGLREENARVIRAANDAAAALAVCANHAKHSGCADQDNLASIRGFALEAFHQARAALGDK